MKKKILVLDTSLFVNPDSARNFGNSPTEAFINFLERAKDSAKLSFWMPPSIFTELMHFVDEGQVPHKLLVVIHKKPPKKHETKIPGIFLYKLVAEVRDRTDRSLRLAERTVREALETDPAAVKRPFEPGQIRPDAQAISSLRESFRRITREGMLDSKEDADLLLLAYEIEGTLVSCDQGVIDWAHELGIPTISHKHLLEVI